MWYRHLPSLRLSRCDIFKAWSQHKTSISNETPEIAFLMFMDPHEILRVLSGIYDSQKKAVMLPGSGWCLHQIKELWSIGVWWQFRFCFWFTTLSSCPKRIVPNIHLVFIPKRKHAWWCALLPTGILSGTCQCFQTIVITTDALTPGWDIGK